MKKLLTLITVGLSVSAWAAWAADGKELYTKDCAKCHGADGKGQTKTGQKLRAKDYTDPKVQEALKDDAAIKAVKEGVKAKDGTVLMKPAEVLNDEEIKAVLAYLRKFKK